MFSLLFSPFVTVVGFNRGSDEDVNVDGVEVCIQSNTKKLNEIPIVNKYKHINRIDHRVFVVLDALDALDVLDIFVVDVDVDDALVPRPRNFSIVSIFCYLIVMLFVVDVSVTFWGWWGRLSVDRYKGLFFAAPILFQTHIFDGHGSGTQHQQRRSRKLRCRTTKLCSTNNTSCE